MNQNTSFHHQVGAIECIAFNDGTLVNPESDDGEIFGLNCLFIDTGDHRILVDSGCGNGFQETAGRLTMGLAEEGIAPDSIDIILITHGHIDHVGGITGKDVNAFPNARYAVLADEWDFWLTNPKHNDLETMLFEAARKDLILQQTRFSTLENGAEIVKGVRVFAAPGHSPGHATVEVSSEGERLLGIGDILHSAKEFTEPGYLALFDVDPQTAMSTRSKILMDVAQSEQLVFACHFMFPGFGFIESGGDVYSWKPIKATV